VTEANRAEMLAQLKRRAQVLESELRLYPVVQPDGHVEVPALGADDTNVTPLVIPTPPRQELDILRIVE